jgi:hypothetical protein
MDELPENFPIAHGAWGAGLFRAIGRENKMSEALYLALPVATWLHLRLTHRFASSLAVTFAWLNVGVSM